MYWKGLQKTVQSHVKKCHCVRWINAETTNMENCQ
jgi:hypothetical protein